MRLLAVIDLPDWRDLRPDRWNQPYRNEMKDRLKLIGNAIANNQSNEGIGWKLEPSPVTKPEEEAA
jgi:hypothetical protein